MDHINAQVRRDITWQESPPCGHFGNILLDQRLKPDSQSKASPQQVKRFGEEVADRRNTVDPADCHHNIRCAVLSFYICCCVLP